MFSSIEISIVIEKEWKELINLHIKENEFYRVNEYIKKQTFTY